MRKNQHIFVPSFLVLFGYFLIYLSSVAIGKFPNTEFHLIWIVVPISLSGFFIIRLIKKVGAAKTSISVWWFIFLGYISLNSVVSLLVDQNFSKTGLQIIIFLTIASCLLLTQDSPDFSRRFNSVYSIVIVILCLLAISQALSHFLHLPVFGDEFYSGRYSPGYQATAIFGEPAHFAGFLIAATYFMVITRRGLLFFLLVLLAALVTKSVSAILSVCLLVVISTFVTGTRRVLLFLGFVLVIYLFIDNFSYVVARLNSEVFELFSLVGSPYFPHQEVQFGSGHVRVINELNFLLSLSVFEILFGLGSGYDKEFVGRLMSLNGFVEFICRFGVVGSFLFGILVIRELVRFRCRHLVLFWTALILVFVSDGSIATLTFWLPIICIFWTNRLVRATEVYKCDF